MKTIKFYQKIIISILILLFVTACIIYFYNYGSPFDCVFYKKFNLYCTGCGSGRAIYAMLHFDLVKALSYNALFVVAVPVLGLYFVNLYIQFITGKKLIKYQLKIKECIIIIVVIILFTVIRNIPFLPFGIPCY